MIKSPILRPAGLARGLTLGPLRAVLPLIPPASGAPYEPEGTGSRTIPPDAAPSRSSRDACPPTPRSSPAATPPGTPAQSPTADPRSTSLPACAATSHSRSSCINRLNARHRPALGAHDSPRRLARAVSHSSWSSVTCFRPPLGVGIAKVVWSALKSRPSAVPSHATRSNVVSSAHPPHVGGHVVKCIPKLTRRWPSRTGLGGGCVIYPYRGCHLGCRALMSLQLRSRLERFCRLAELPLRGVSVRQRRIYSSARRCVRHILGGHRDAERTEPTRRPPSQSAGV